MNRLVPLQDITVDQTVQARSQIDSAVVEHFATMYREDTDPTGRRLPPVSLIEIDTGQLILADGFTRFEAARRSGIEAISAIISQGTRRDAILLNITENSRHGVSLTPAERHNCACLLVTDDEWCKMSDREIGRRCGLDNKTVSAIRREHAPNTVGLPRTVRRGASSYEMTVAKHASEEIPQMLQRRECTHSTNARRREISKTSMRSAAARDTENVHKLAEFEDRWETIRAQLDEFSQKLDSIDPLIRDRFLRDNPIATEILRHVRSRATCTKQPIAAEHVEA